jgi:hypothetical protein
MRTTFKNLVVFSLVSSTFFSCGSDGSEDGAKGTPALAEKSHFTVAAISTLEKNLRGDSTSCNENYDLYFDFSATMKRAVNDQNIKDLITNAFDGLGTSDKIYSIGENKDLKEITGDKATKQNSVLGPANYTQMMTYMTPNINNIAANLDRPAIIFSDFSVDEGRPTTDADGVTSSFVRGSEYANQIKSWFMNGGSVKVYGKMIAEGGSPMPVYAIAFLPAGFNEKHRMSRILGDLERLLSKDMYFDLHTRFGKVEASPEEVKDARKLAVNGSCQSLENGYGEIMKFNADKLMGVASDKALREVVEGNFVSGINFSPDSTSFLMVSGFSGESQIVVPASKEALSKETSVSNPFFKELTFTDNSIKFGYDFNKAKQANLYQKDQLLRYRISVSGVQKSIRFDSDKATKTLQYKLKSGGKMIMNNCLFKSIEKAMQDCANEYKPAEAAYSVYFFIKKK